MFNDRFAQLMALQFSGEATDEEIRELQIFLEQNPQAQLFFEVFTDYWALETKESSNDIQDEIHFQQIIAIAEKEGNQTMPPGNEDKNDNKSSKIFSLKKLLAAAIFIGVITISYFLIVGNTTQLPSNSLNEVVAKTGTRSYLMLTDGSKVWLNSESKLEFKSNFNDSVREVTLEGEAFFEVAKDKNRPFIVHTSDLDIRVLGTAFNVKSYPKESQIETTLIHGKVEVTNKKDPASHKMILGPHDKLVFNKIRKASQVQKDGKPVVSITPFEITTLPKNLSDTAIAETSWIYNKLVFDGETFREIALKMERWYNVRISFKSEKVANVPIHVTFKDESIEEALRALQVIEPFAYQINGNEIEILKK
jgi:ferric-dicitrate binding protein FerR (iron transport regulator)